MNNTIEALLAKATQRLSSPTSSSSDTARLDAELLLSHVLQKSRSYLFTWPDKALSDEDSAAFHLHIEQRFSGLPVAYLTGQKAFWTLDLQVNAHVLIPRPDTELIVELALSQTLPDNAVAADLGTGSGAIALAMATERPNWRIYATDQSVGALATAANNAAKHDIENVTFLSGNWCQALGNKRPHIIVTNPPYIRQDDHHLQQGDVRFEPSSALTSGADGLNDIRHIVKESVRQLLPGGWLLIEHGFEQGQAVADLLDENKYRLIRTEKDLAGHDRVTLAQWGKS
ncbi:peptide chain release factor N(5)-glutamine methyltransferase [Endozoicomonas sp.]|nr:peptide chain release factor N(5)-glutamine methyltransferase [Endozoicomonas sp.]